MIDASELLVLLEEFHITDRGLQRAVARARLSHDDAAGRALRKETLRYFSCMEREAKRHLADLDRRLDDLYQRQYNLQAERAVAQRRLIGAAKLLRALAPQIPDREGPAAG